MGKHETVIPLRISKELDSRLRSRAKHEFRTVQALIRLVLAEYLNKPKAGTR
jgi:hypothetical protein